MSKGIVLECNYIPQSQNDIDTFYDTREPFMTQNSRVYHYPNKPDEIPGSLDAFVGPMRYLNRENGNFRFVRTDIMYQPHTMIVEFSGCGGNGKQMTF